MSKLTSILKSRLVKNGIWLFMLQGFNTVVPLLTIPYITRVLGAEQYGVFSLALNWVTYFQVFVEYGFGYTGARKVSTQNESEIQPLYCRIITARIILLFFSITFLMIISLVIKKSVDHYISMAILFLMIIGVAFQLTWLFQGKQDMKYITIVNAVSRLVSVVLVFLLVRNRSHLYLYCFCYSVTFVASALIGIIIAKRQYGLTVRFCKLKEAISEIKDGWHLFVSQAMAKIIGAVGITVLGGVATLSEIGIYNAIYRLPQIMILFFNPISQVLYPHISIMFSKSFQEGRLAIKRAMKIIFPIFVVCGLLVCIFRVMIIKIAFGSEYLEYDLITIPLIVWMLISVANNFLGVQFLVASNNQKLYSHAVTISAVFTITFNLVLGYIYGVYGIAVAAPLGELVLMIILLIDVKLIITRNDPNNAMSNQVLL